MEPRISIVTLGVANLARSRAFYEAMGFRASSGSQGDIVFFQAGAMVLALYPREALAEDAAVAAEGDGFRGLYWRTMSAREKRWRRSSLKPRRPAAGS
jgi:hypothetical protein